MSEDLEKQPVRQLSLLMEEVIKLCNELYDYTNTGLRDFVGEDDTEIAEIINSRKKYVDSISELECRIDLLLENEGEAISLHADELPYDIEEFRKKARAILRKVSELDMNAMKQISSKMQKYKDETLKLRNKKNLSAYIRSGTPDSSVSHYDVKK